MKMNRRGFTGACLASFLLLCQLQASASGPIVISNPRINEAPPGASVTAGYFLLENHGGVEVELATVTSTGYGSIEIHRTVIREGVAGMQRQTSIKVPAGDSVEFKPGDYHLMLFRPMREFRAGDEVEIVFHFTGGLEVSATAKVEGMEETPAAAHPHSHH